MALSNQTFSDFGTAASDIFAGIGDKYKQQGDLIEQSMYQSDAALALQNEQFTKTSTAIKLAQTQRGIAQSLGNTQAQAAGAGLAETGSVKDILAESASQGELTKQVLQQQGLITEAGYKEQAQAYQDQAEAAGLAAKAAGTASIGSDISGAIAGVAAVATLLI